MNDILWGLLSAVITGVVASIVYSLILLVIRPKVKISKEICMSKNTDGTMVYKIKVVNKSFAMLTNLKYSLYYCVEHGDGNETITEIKSRKTSILNINRYRLAEDKTDYAVRISYLIDPREYPVNDNCSFRFSFIADHALSNTTRSLSKVYRKEDIIEGNFQMGATTKIQVMK